MPGLAETALPAGSSCSGSGGAEATSSTRGSQPEVGQEGATWSTRFSSQRRELNPPDSGGEPRQPPPPPQQQQPLFGTATSREQLQGQGQGQWQGQGQGGCQQPWLWRQDQEDVLLLSAKGGSLPGSSLPGSAAAVVSGGCGFGGRALWRLGLTRMVRMSSLWRRGDVC
ncbi:hypothetical protein PLESTF_001057500 [Pleodorina starrii]|nr:hypothetical protein PLESTF_001057500 [Pleodorina starrii]